MYTSFNIQNFTVQISSLLAKHKHFIKAPHSIRQFVWLCSSCYTWRTDSCKSLNLRGKRSSTHAAVERHETFNPIFICALQFVKRRYVFVYVFEWISSEWFLCLCENIFNGRRPYTYNTEQCLFWVVIDRCADSSHRGVGPKCLRQQMVGKHLINAKRYYDTLLLQTCARPGVDSTSCNSIHLSCWTDSVQCRWFDYVRKRSHERTV